MTRCLLCSLDPLSYPRQGLALFPARRPPAILGWEELSAAVLVSSIILPPCNETIRKRLCLYDGLVLPARARLAVAAVLA